MTCPLLERVEVEGVAGIIVAADAAIKTAEIKLLGEIYRRFYDCIFESPFSDVNAGLASGHKAVESLAIPITSSSITQPDPSCLCSRHLLVWAVQKYIRQH